MDCLKESNLLFSFIIIILYNFFIYLILLIFFFFCSYYNLIFNYLIFNLVNIYYVFLCFSYFLHFSFCCSLLFLWKVCLGYNNSFVSFVSFDSLSITSNNNNKESEGSFAACFENEGKKEEGSEEEKKGGDNMLSCSTSLSSLPLSFSNSSKIKRDGNVIMHIGEENFETCVFGKEMKTVFFYI